MYRYTYETDNPDRWPVPVRLIAGPAVAWWILGWQTEPDEDTEWSGIESRTDWLVACMVGDDARHLVEETDIAPLDRSEYCAGCGQIGCGWC